MISFGRITSTYLKDEISGVRRFWSENNPSDASTNFNASKALTTDNNSNNE